MPDISKIKLPNDSNTYDIKDLTARNQVVVISNGASTSVANAIGVDATNGVLKIGDGTTSWNNLPSIPGDVTATKQKLVKTTVPNITSVGSAPTLGTAFSVPNVTGNTSVSASKVTKTDDTFVKTISQATSTSSVIGTVSSGVLTLSQAITAVGAVSAGTTGTASAVSISNVTATNTTLGTAFSIPNVTSVGSAPTLGTAISVATGAVSASGTGSEVVVDVSSS